MQECFCRIIDLWEKKRNSTISPEELDEYNSIIKDRNLYDVIESLENDDKLIFHLREQHRFNKDLAFKNFRKATRHYKLKKYITTSAALVIMLVGIWFLSTHKNDTYNQINILPNYNTSILILSNGEQVKISGRKIPELKSIGIIGGKDSLIYKSTPKSEIEYNELIVPNSGEFFIKLSDGTKIWINSESHLKYPVKFSEKDRLVYLEGEAYFEVVNNDKPFIVQTKLGNIKVSGTEFNVKAYNNENRVITTLVNGKVCFLGEKKIILNSGEQCLAYRGEIPYKKKVNVFEHIGWRYGIYIFTDRVLEDIMQDLCKWYGVTVTYSNNNLKKIKFSGNLRRYESINVFMEMMKRTGSISYRISNNNIHIYREDITN